MLNPLNMIDACGSNSGFKTVSQWFLQVRSKGRRPYEMDSIILHVGRNCFMKDSGLFSILREPELVLVFRRRPIISSLECSLYTSESNLACSFYASVALKSAGQQCTSYDTTTLSKYGDSSEFF